MWGNLIARLTVFALRSKRLTGESRTEVMSALLENLVALKTKDVITYDLQGSVLINGRRLDIEQARTLIEACKALKDNFARKLLRDQIAFEATKLAVHNGLTPEMIQFGKAAIWWGQQEEKLLATLVNE